MSSAKSYEKQRGEGTQAQETSASDTLDDIPDELLPSHSVVDQMETVGQWMAAIGGLLMVLAGLLLLVPVTELRWVQTISIRTKYATATAVFGAILLSHGVIALLMKQRIAYVNERQ